MGPRGPVSTAGRGARRKFARRLPELKVRVPEGGFPSSGPLPSAFVIAQARACHAIGLAGLYRPNDRTWRGARGTVYGVQAPDLETIKQRAMASYNHEEVLPLESEVLLAIPAGVYLNFAMLDVKWRPYVTMRRSSIRVHIVIESHALRDKHASLPSRHQFRLALEQSSLRDDLAAAVYPLRGRYVVPGGYWFTWTVGSVMFAEDPLLGEEDYLRPSDIDADTSDPWVPSSKPRDR